MWYSLKILRILSLTLTLAVTPVAMAQAVDQQIGSLNLRDVDIQVLIETVADVTGRNFLVDPRVKANVTVVSSKPMQAEELYQVFLSILQVHGFAAIPAGGVVKIVPDSSAKSLAATDPTLADTAEADQIVTRVLQVDHVDANKLVPILRPLVPQNGHVAAYPQGNSIVVSDRAGNVKRIASIIHRIDQADQEEIEVIRLSHASSAEVVRIIQGLENNRRRSKARGNAPLLAADERTNSILLGGDPSTRLELRTLIAHLDTPIEDSGNTQVIFLRYAKAEEVADIIKGISDLEEKAKRKAKAADSSEVNIQADVSNNALVITAPPDRMRNYRSVVRQLDIRRAQVLIEAVIAEVSTDLTEELGTQFAVGNIDGDSTTPLGFTNFGPNSIANIASSVLTGGFPTLGSGAFLGVGNVGGSGTQWAILINALTGDAATNILSTPSLVATDNEEATIVVGQNVPFVTGQFSNTGGTANAVNPFQTIERQDVGITLTVTPQINEGDSIRLEISQEVSSLASTSISTSDVVTNKRSIDTTVTVQDGQVIVLGGLIEDRFQDSEQKVPLFGDLPVVGKLFSYSSRNKVKQNLMVFLRPVVITDPALAGDFASRKYSLLRERQLTTRIRQRIGEEEGAGLPDRLETLFERGQTKPTPPVASPAKDRAKVDVKTQSGWNIQPTDVWKH